MTIDVVPHDMLEDETLVERRMRVLTMRNAGATFTQVADRLNEARIELGLEPLSMTTFRKDYDRALLDVASASREELLAVESSVLLDVRRAHYTKMMGGDIDATRAVLATVEQRRRMFGLDAPTSTAHGISDVDFAEKMYAAIVELGLQPPKEITDGVRHGRDDAEFASGTKVTSSRPSGSPAARPHPKGSPFGKKKTHPAATNGPAAGRRRTSDDDVLDAEVVPDPEGSGWSNL